MSYGNRFPQKGLDPSSAKQVLEYLFGKDGAGKFLDTKTEITDRNTFKTLMYYRILEEQCESEAAGAIASVIERLAISSKRMGRLEGVAVLKQEMPRVETIIRTASQEMDAKDEG